MTLLIKLQTIVLRAALKASVVIILLLCISKEAYSQEQAYVAGQVFSLEDSLPVYNAHIYIQGTSYGTTSNEEEEFSFHIRPEHRKGTMVVSYIGHIPFSLEVQGALNNRQFVYLKKEDITLREVTVSAVDAKKIVRAAINRIPDNYSRKKKLYDIHYKEIRKRDEDYLSYLEVSADLISKGFDNKHIGSKNYNSVNLKGKRTSYNYDSAYNDQNGLFTVFWVNWARGFLSMKALEAYSFSYHGLTSYGSEAVYKIWVSKPGREDETCLYISKEDYAVIAIEYFLENSTQKKPERNENWWFVNLQLRIDFHERENTWYVNTISDYRKSMDVEGRVSESSRSIRVLNVENILKFSQKHKITHETDLFNYPIAYDSVFWEQYNAPLETAEEGRIKAELERNGIELQKQFRTKKEFKDGR